MASIEYAPYRDGENFIFPVHPDSLGAVILQHCEDMGFASLALWLFPCVSRLDQIYKQGWGIPGLR